ncbi:hypothetical protein D9611_008234 [Ephemerocybe angulata]|uniref:Uncharacterized protein n=1 Tax=Ephemerocybe angulata TaxID=980116 RepID=A0A8H5BI74_9AGAR|nr:hypothetical protein D9611_008234 [Tulosesus angulatus]
MFPDCTIATFHSSPSPSIISMMAGPCIIPGNPDIAGIGVRIAIYVQNLLCFLPAFWALFDGKVTQGELDAAETQATTNLVLAFAILISAIVQAQTLGLTNYDASIILNMSWMNNTNAFIYFLLYMQHKSQAGIRGQVEPTWRAWVQHVRELAISVIHPGTAKANVNGADSDPELGQMKGADAASIRSGAEGTRAKDPQGHDDYARTGAKLLVKRFVLLLGSIHLSLMAGLGLWLWSNIRAFGEGQDDANDCAAKHVFLAILGKHVPFASEALRVVSLVIYAVFLVPGVNLLLPIVVFLVFYHLHRVTPTPKVAGSGSSGATIDAYIRQSKLRFWIRRTYNSIVHRWGIFPPFVGLILLLAINLVFIIDIELALKQNASLQGDSKDEAEWSFGQILAMLLLFMPLRDLAETFLARRMKQRQKDLDMGLIGAINLKDTGMVPTWISRGANPNIKREGDTSPMRIACQLQDLDVIRILLEAGSDPNVKGGHRRDAYTVESDNRACLRLLNEVEKGSLDGGKALLQAVENGYGAGVMLLLQYLGLAPDPDRTQAFFEALSGINVNAKLRDGMPVLLSTVTRWSGGQSQNLEAIVKFLLSAPGIDVNAADFNGRTPLSFAARYGHEAIAKLLLAVPGIDVNATDDNGRTPLSFAAKYGHAAVAELLLTTPGINANAPDSDGRIPLSFSAASGHEAVVKLLLAVPGIDVNFPDTRGWTPLSLAAGAAGGSHAAVVKLLLAAPGIDVNATDDNGRTPLSFVAKYGHAAVAELLLATPGINANAPDGDGRTPLSFSAASGHEAVVKLLLAAPGIEVNALETHRGTPLSFAAEGGHKAIVQLLLAMPGIDVNAAGWTALSAAAKNGHEAIVKLLLTTPGVDVNVADADGRTPLRFAAEQRREAIIKLLLAAPGIEVNAPDTHRRTPLRFAAEGGHKAVINLLLAAPGIDVNAADANGSTPLSFAAENGHGTVAELLLAAPGINVNAPGINGLTPLSSAVVAGFEAVVKLLLAAPGIDVNAAADAYGLTPLRFAATYGYRAVAELLLAAPGIDVNAADKYGRTPLKLAAENGHEDVVKLLLATPGIDLNVDHGFGWTPLILAAKNGHQSLVKLFLTTPGIDINAAGFSGGTALTWAVFAGKEAVVQELCACPKIIVDVADVKRHIEKNPPEFYPASKDKQEKCLRILEEFVESKSKGGGAEDGEGISGG